MDNIQSDNHNEPIVSNGNIPKSNGRFVKGHPFYKSTTGIKNGRKRTIKREVKDALSLAQDALPSIILSMIERAQGKNNESAQVQQAASEYLCDRIYGRPNQPLSNASKTPLASFIFNMPGGTHKTAKEMLDQSDISKDMTHAIISPDAMGSV